MPLTEFRLTKLRIWPVTLTPRARYYSPSLQRFVSEDPAGFKGGINLYSYVENSPVTYRDPLGLMKVCVWVGDADLFSDVTNERQSTGPWRYVSASFTQGPARGPGAGGVNPPGFRPFGLPIPTLNCLYQRDIVYQKWETTWFLKTFLCVASDCSGTRVWPQFQLDKRRNLLGTFTYKDQTVTSRWEWVSNPITDEIKCKNETPLQ